MLPGPTNENVKDGATILKVRPCQFGPAWSDRTLPVGRDIDSQKWLYTDGSAKEPSDNIAFTLYVLGPKDAGQLQISYEVEFSHPHPF